MKLIVERLAPTRNLSYEPYVQAFFDYQDGSSNSLSLDGLSTEIVSVSAWREKLELRLEAVEWADRLECALAYRTELSTRTPLSR